MKTLCLVLFLSISTFASSAWSDGGRGPSPAERFTYKLTSLSPLAASDKPRAYKAIAETLKEHRISKDSSKADILSALGNNRDLVASLASASGLSLRQFDSLMKPKVCNGEDPLGCGSDGRGGEELLGF
jgi:hypothetical protein